MHLFSGKLILIIMAVALLLGGMVMLCNPDYTWEKNVASNRDYYPSVKIAQEGDGNGNR